MARKRSNIIAINDLRTSDTSTVDSVRLPAFTVPTELAVALDAKRFEGRYNRLSDLLSRFLQTRSPRSLRIPSNEHHSVTPFLPSVSANNSN